MMPHTQPEPQLVPQTRALSGNRTLSAYNWAHNAVEYSIPANNCQIVIPAHLTRLFSEGREQA
jgi:hypothetical protein